MRGTCSLPFVVDPDVNVTEPEVDAGNLEGELSASDVEVEFGAAQLGISVDRVLVLENIGNASLTVQQVFINGDASGEFSVSPEGNVDEELAPDDSLQLSLSHTPLDGEEDVAELFIVHNGPNSPLIISLIAEFKGTSGLSVTDDLASLAPDTAQLDLGNVPIGAVQTARVFIRNDGTTDSLLNIDNVYLTPTEGPFSLDVNVPAELESFDATCMDDVLDCPADAAACESGACVDAAGAPMGGVQAVVRFSPVDESIVHATLPLNTTKPVWMHDAIFHWSLTASRAAYFPLLERCTL
ncbi:MAG: choice-of-anchor D domain-containing protein [Deltaproteobacteria bacterium]|nr:choice-of-anchor D domain-containing protein [Deltaproteobacteria bacterium]